MSSVGLSVTSLDQFIKSNSNQEKYVIGQGILRDVTNNDVQSSVRVFLEFMNKSENSSPDGGEMLMDGLGFSSTTASCVLYAMTGSLAFPIAAGAICVAWAAILLAKKYIDAYLVPQQGQSLVPELETKFTNTMNIAINAQIQDYDHNTLIAFYKSAQKRLEDFTIVLKALWKKNYQDADLKSRLPSLYRDAENALHDVMVQCQKDKTDIPSLPMFAIAATLRFLLQRDCLIYGVSHWGMHPDIVRDNDKKNIQSTLLWATKHVKDTYAKAERKAIETDARNDVNTFNRLMTLRNAMTVYVFQYANLWEYITSEPYQSMVYPQKSHLLASPVVGCPVMEGNTSAILSNKKYYRAPLAQLQKRIAADKPLYWRGQPHGIFGQSDLVGHYIAWYQNSFHEPTMIDTPDVRNSQKSGLDDLAYVGQRFGLTTDNGSTYQEGMYIDACQVEYDLVPRSILTLHNKGVATFSLDWNPKKTLPQETAEWSWHLQMDQYEFANQATPYHFIQSTTFTYHDDNVYRQSMDYINNRKEIFKFDGYRLHSLYSFGVNLQYNCIDSVFATFMPKEAVGINYIVQPQSGEKHATIIDAIRAKSSSGRLTPYVEQDGVMLSISYLNIPPNAEATYEVDYGGVEAVTTQFKINVCVADNSPQTMYVIRVDGERLEDGTNLENQKITLGTKTFAISGSSMATISIRNTHSNNTLRLRSLIFVPQ